ncbi:MULTISPECIES: hypothetical protein [unclassified Streptomyces]|uniref:hypothetical protein n=1 Tax=unclassified Streptomyces TaxID=2593676 RepID=UPI0036496399
METLDHPLLHQQVRDPKTGRAGTLMAVSHETLGYAGGRERKTHTAWIRGADGIEFTAAAATLEATA